MNEHLTKVCCRPGTAPSDAHAFAEHAQRFKALSDPARVAIVNRLASRGEACVCELVSVLDLAQPTVSHHLRVLREAGLIQGEIEGPATCYCINQGGVQYLKTQIDRWLPKAIPFVCV